MKNEEESTSEFSSFNSQFICYICILFKRILKANQALIDQAKDGLGFRGFDKIPRDIIVEAG